MTPAPFIWYDLVTTDMDAATRFYSSVIGWSIADSGMPGMTYSVLKASGAMVGGMMGMPAGFGVPPMWNGYVYSADVDADTARAVALGGKERSAPNDIPGVGRFSIIADPHGALIHLFKPSTSETPAKTDPFTPGHVGWRELHAGDLDEAWAFYSALLGWSKSEAMEMPGMGTYQMFAIGPDGMAGGMMTKAPTDPAPPHWNYYFNVASIDAAVQRIKELGGEILQGPDEVPGGMWSVNARDPQGAMFSIVGNT